MSQEIEEDAPSTSEGEGKSKVRLIPILVIPIVAVASFFFVTKVINPRFAGAATVQEQDEEQDSSKEDDVEGIICELGTVLANPAGVGVRRIMKVGISLEVTSKEAAAEVEKSKTKLQHQLIVTLASKDLNAIASAEGKLTLQSEIAKIFESELGTEPGELRQVYFTEFVIQ
jgi:flagellar basal body-associated protein FliL